MANVAAALILSLLAPGAGQIYNGHYLKAAIAAIVYAMLMTVIFPLTVRAFKIYSLEKALKTAKIFNYALICVVLLSVLDACVNAWFKTATLKTDIIYAIVYVLCVTLLHKNLKNKILVTMLSGSGVVGDIVTGSGKFTNKSA